MYESDDFSSTIFYRFVQIKGGSEVGTFITKSHPEGESLLILREEEKVALWPSFWHYNTHL